MTESKTITVPILNPTTYTVATRNGYSHPTTISLVSWDEWVSIRFSSKTTEVLNAGGSIPPEAMDELATEWLKFRGYTISKELHP